jgi:choline-glycine betaine transporter
MPYRDSTPDLAGIGIAVVAMLLAGGIGIGIFLYGLIRYW